jgi:ribosomal subunit interface protein
MDIHVHTHHCSLTEEENASAIQAAEHLQHYFPRIIRVDTFFTEEHSAKLCEIKVHVQGHTIVGKVEGTTFTKAIHDTAENVKRQLVKLNEKLHDVRPAIKAAQQRMG